jgi:hypothetical protein
MNKILQTNNELWDKVWWNRHQVWREKIESGEEDLTESQREVFAGDCETAARIKESAAATTWVGMTWARPSGGRAVGSQLRREGGE